MEVPEIVGFEVRDARPPERVASMTDGTTLHHDVRRDGTYLLRVQPELLRSGRYTMVQRTLASLPFPVSGLTAKAVQSDWDKFDKTLSFKLRLRAANAQFDQAVLFRVG